MVASLTGPTQFQTCKPLWADEFGISDFRCKIPQTRNSLAGISLYYCFPHSISLFSRDASLDKHVWHPFDVFDVPDRTVAHLRSQVMAGRRLAIKTSDRSSPYSMLVISKLQSSNKAELVAICSSWAQQQKWWDVPV